MGGNYGIDSDKLIAFERAATMLDNLGDVTGAKIYRDAANDDVSEVAVDDSVSDLQSYILSVKEVVDNYN